MRRVQFFQPVHDDSEIQPVSSPRNLVPPSTPDQVSRQSNLRSNSHSDPRRGAAVAQHTESVSQLLADDDSLRSTLLPAAHQIDRSSCFIPCPPRALSPPDDEESRALHCAVAQFYTDLLFSFFQMVISINLKRAYSVFRAIAPFSILRITWLKRKRMCMKRVLTSVVLALCISTAPLCAKGQVYARDLLDVQCSKIQFVLWK